MEKRAGRLNGGEPLNLRDFKSRHVADEWPDETPRDFVRQSLGKSGDPLIYPSSSSPLVLLSLRRRLSMYSYTLCVSLYYAPAAFLTSPSSTTPCVPFGLSRASVTFNRTGTLSRLNFSRIVLGQRPVKPPRRFRKNYHATVSRFLYETQCYRSPDAG